MIVADGIYYALGLTAGGLLVSYLAHPWFGLPLFILAAFRPVRWRYRRPTARWWR
jgi:hypothetical protein